MGTILVQLVTAVVPFFIAWMQRRYDLKELEAGRKKVKDGKLVTSPPEKEKEEPTEI